MKSIKLIILILLSFNLNGQNAQELNSESKLLIDNQKFEEAIPILKKAAKLGNPESQYNLGVCYQFGYGVEKNDSLSTNWYKKSADQGWKDGQYKMSFAHIKGNGVKKDEKKAFEYALLCADQEDVECIFNVISCFKDGIGTEKDSLKVLEWAIKLGKMKTPENLKISGQITSARLNLAYMYLEGNEVEKNLVRSYSWFLIYNESKRDFSVQIQEQQVQKIKKLEEKLTKREMKKARKIAEEILDKNLENFKNLYQWNK